MTYSKPFNHTQQTLARKNSREMADSVSKQENRGITAKPYRSYKTK